MEVPPAHAKCSASTPPTADDAVHFEPDETRSGAFDEMCEQVVELPALGVGEVTDPDAAGMGAEVAQGFSVFVRDHRVSPADAVVFGVFDVADGRERCG